MDEQQNWDPRPPYGSGPQYDQPNYQQPGAPYGSASQSPGYDFNTASRTPQYGSGMGYGNQTNQYIDDDGAKGMATASMVLGIISLSISLLGFMAIAFFICFLPLILSIIGLLLGMNANKKYDLTGATNGQGMAKAGVIMNMICLILSILGVLLSIVSVIWVFSMPM